MKILIEATGSLTSNFLIKAIHDSGHIAIGSDISDFNHSKILCDEFIIMPKVDDKELWNKISGLLEKYQIDIVIPSLDETLLDWSKRVNYFKSNNIDVIISPEYTIDTFQDKWKTYQFFKDIGVLTPNTSLESTYQIIKPRFGRGGSGIFENDFNTKISMDNMISQEKIIGREYTVDTFFNIDGEPIYIVPRLRIDVKNGKSTKGIVVQNDEINELIIKIANKITFYGPINFQLFETEEGQYYFIEINPRIAGGMALGIAATANWIQLIVDNFIHKKKIEVQEIKYGMKMVRFYDEIFI